jgi:hypothetical protein
VLGPGVAVGMRVSLERPCVVAVVVMSIIVAVGVLVIERLVLVAVRVDLGQV